MKGSKKLVGRIQKMLINALLCPCQEDSSHGGHSSVKSKVCLQGYKTPASNFWSSCSFFLYRLLTLCSKSSCTPHGCRVYKIYIVFLILEPKSVKPNMFLLLLRENCSLLVKLTVLMLSQVCMVSRNTVAFVANCSSIQGEAVCSTWRLCVCGRGDHIAGCFSQRLIIMFSFVDAW